MIDPSRIELAVNLRRSPRREDTSVSSANAVPAQDDAPAASSTNSELWSVEETGAVSGMHFPASRFTLVQIAKSHFVHRSVYRRTDGHAGFHFGLDQQRRF